MTPSPTGWPGSTSVGPDGAAAPSGSGGAAPSGAGADDLGADEAADLADRVAAAALSVPGVVSLHGGAVGEVATLLPGRRVPGVRLPGPGGGTYVHVVASTSSPLPRTAQAVRAAVGRVVHGPVHVVVGDVATPDEPGRPTARPEVARP